VWATRCGAWSFVEEEIPRIATATSTTATMTDAMNHLVDESGVGGLFSGRLRGETGSTLLAMGRLISLVPCFFRIISLPMLGVERGETSLPKTFWASSFVMGAYSMVLTPLAQFSQKIPFTCLFFAWPA